VIARRLLPDSLDPGTVSSGPGRGGSGPIWQRLTHHLISQQQYSYLIGARPKDAT